MPHALTDKAQASGDEDVLRLRAVCHLHCSSWLAMERRDHAPCQARYVAANPATYPPGASQHAEQQAAIPPLLCCSMALLPLVDCRWTYDVVQSSVLE